MFVQNWGVDRIPIEILFNIVAAAKLLDPMLNTTCPVILQVRYQSLTGPDVQLV